MHTDRYSRMVAWLKVSLPLLALAILSTLFLISRAADPPVTIPFADSEVQDRLTNQQATGPYFSGISANGDQIDFVADTVRAMPDSIGTNIAENVDVNVDFVSGVKANLTAKEAVINIAEDRTRLTGDVVIVTSQGYVLESDLMLVRMSSPDMNSPGPVTGTTPVGTIDAGTMHFFVPDDTGDSQLVFTNGVKLLYQPKK
jgi:lipopolysaccharide export system protein LptC